MTSKIYIKYEAISLLLATLVWLGSYTKESDLRYMLCLQKYCYYHALLFYYNASLDIFSKVGQTHTHTHTHTNTHTHSYLARQRGIKGTPNQIILLVE